MCRTDSNFVHEDNVDDVVDDAGDTEGASTDVESVTENASSASSTTAINRPSPQQRPMDKVASELVTFMRRRAPTERDEEELFVLSLAPALRRMDVTQRAACKQAMLKVVIDHELAKNTQAQSLGFSSSGVTGFRPPPDNYMAVPQEGNWSSSWGQISNVAVPPNTGADTNMYTEAQSCGFGSSGFTGSRPTQDVSMKVPQDTGGDVSLSNVVATANFAVDSFNYV